MRRRVPQVLTPIAMAGLLLMSSACQSLDEEGAEMSGSVLALYASAAEAVAVSQGQFGAHPIALVQESELEPATGCLSGTVGQAGARCMRSRSTGRLGWLPD